MKLIIMGPQGSGKGTQADLIAKKYGIVHISTGDIIRKNISEGTELGKTFKEYADNGKLVPDNLIMEMVNARLGDDDCKNGFIFDGFPRNTQQAEELEEISSVDAVVVVDVSDRESIRRIEGRRSCKCGAVYHTFYNPSKIAEVCDKCGGRLVQRDDDREEIIKDRLRIYHGQTSPLIEFYGDKVIMINGEQPIEKVFEDITAALS